MREKVFGRLNDALDRFSESQSGVATPDTGADELVKRGFAEKSAQ